MREAVKLLQQFEGRATLLLSSTETKHEDVMLETLDFLVNKRNMKGVVLSAAESAAIITEYMRKLKIPPDRLFIIDTASSDTLLRRDNVLFLPPPFNPIDASLVIGQMLVGGERSFFIFDTLSAFLSYNPSLSVKFFQYILNDLYTTGKITLLLDIEIEGFPTEKRTIAQYCDVATVLGKKRLYI